MNLRPYQHSAVERVEALTVAGVKAPLIVAPTGSGKTVIAAELIRRAGDRRTLFLAPRRELIHQTCRKLDDVGVGYGVLLAGDRRTNLDSTVQVASVDTLISRVLRSRRLQLAPFHQVIVDEAHVGLTARRQALLALWPDATIIGLTATPCRSDGKAMGSVYDEIIEVASVRELTDAGFLVPARYFSVSEPDLKNVRTTAGDYNKADLDGVMNKAALTGDIVEHFLAHAATRRAAVFATSIAHSVALAQQFLTQGVAAEHVDANTPQHDREAIFERFTNGRTQVLCNCTLASIGFDLPELDCVVFARPTKSLGLYLQMLGRGLRPAPAKQDCLVLDHAGNVHRHGFAADDRYWTLHGKYAQDQAKVKEAQRKKERDGIKEIHCPKCKCVWAGSNTCPECGYYFAPKPKVVRTNDGALVELHGAPASENARRNFFLELYGYGQGRAYKPGWASYKYKERYNEWPPQNWTRHTAQYGGIEPGVASLRWIRSRMIAYQRAKKAEYVPKNTESTQQWLESIDVGV